MRILDSLRRVLGNSLANVPQESSQDGRSRASEVEVRVPEVTAADVIAGLSNGSQAKPLLLDCREDFERRQNHIPNSVHIPMNTIPYRLADLARDQAIVVYCAHGNRSYGVAGWLIQQGYVASSLRGGIVDWQARGGTVESGWKVG
jgi:rhodanese-related sulfurtransferase